LVSAFSGREPKNGSSDRGVPHRARWNQEPRLLNAFGKVGSAPRTNHSKTYYVQLHPKPEPYWITYGSGNVARPAYQVQ